jgi:hypothetical protein
MRLLPNIYHVKGYCCVRFKANVFGGGTEAGKAPEMGRKLQLLPEGKRWALMHISFNLITAHNTAYVFGSSMTPEELPQWDQKKGGIENTNTC